MERDGKPGGASLTASLRRRERVARCCAALSTHLGVAAEEAEVLLLSEAIRRELPVEVLARRTPHHDSPARTWRPATCPGCGATAQLHVTGDYHLQCVLMCPVGHGVIG